MEYQLSPVDYLNILRRRFLFLLFPALIVSVVGILYAMTLPPMYESTGRILVESQQVPDELIRSTVTGLASERIQVLQQRVMTRSNLLRISDKFNLFEGTAEENSPTKIVQVMRSRIGVNRVTVGRNRDQQTLSFSISYEDPDAARALNVTNELITLFLDENVRTRRARATQTTSFLEQEARRLQELLEQLETRIASFKQENSAALPDQLDFQLTALERAEEEIRDAQDERKSITDQLKYLRIELDAARAGARVGSAAVAAGPGEQLESLRMQLLDLQTRYSDDHPDVESLRQRIDSLQQTSGLPASRTDLNARIISKRDKLKELEKTYGPEHPDILQVKSEISELNRRLARVPTSSSGGEALSASQLAASRIDLQISTATERRESLLALEEVLRGRVARLEQGIARMPEVERQLISLQRDYKNSLRKYEEIKEKQLEAQLAENLEEDRKGERFTLLEPPVRPEAPTKPDRPKLILLSIIAAGGVGFACMVLVEIIFGGVSSVAMLEQIANQPPLAVIPVIKTGTEQRRQRRNVVAGIAGLPVLAVISLTAVHFLYMPLDIVWIKAMARF